MSHRNRCGRTYRFNIVMNVRMIHGGCSVINGGSK
jgi:hypothetical protein